MMKWKVMKNSRCNSIDQEDVRKSLEILDNVLAEFDDGAKETSGQLAVSREKNCRDQLEADEIVSDVILRRDVNAECPRSFESYSKKKVENGTSSFPEVSVFLEDDPVSPPPVPKRNPATRLSSREDLVSCKSVENIYSNDFEIRRNIFDTRNRYQIVNDSSQTKPKIRANPNAASSTDLSNLSSNTQLISPKTRSKNLTSAEDSDDVFVSQAKLTLFRSASASVMNASASEKSPSVASRRALYEKSNLTTTESTKRPVIHSDSSDPSFPVRNSPFLRRKFNVPHSPVFHKRNVSDSTDGKSLRFDDPLRVTDGKSLRFDDPLSATDGKSLRFDDPLRVTDGKSLRFDDPLPDTEDRSHSTTNRVSDDVTAVAKPSSSQMTKEQDRIARLNEKFAKVRYLLKTNQIRPLDYDPPSFVPTPPLKKIARKQREASQTDEQLKLKNVQSVSDIPIGQDSGLANDAADVANCPVSFPNNISGISCMLPTDTLNRPHLGLSYSMEDDLSPGVKEILTSTPKNDRSMVGLSTFSQSASSLGYGSGQSDLDLNLSMKEENKQIPVNTLKSQTLPIGMKLGPPFSYVTDIDYDCDIVSRMETKLEEKAAVKHEAENGHFRSSSAPPIKHLQRKSKFGMSKKAPKEEKYKKDDSISIKSELSLDEGILYRKGLTIDGSTENQDLPERKQNNSSFSGEKTKRRSVWKSILRRK